jgi:hypothetical protein
MPHRQSDFRAKALNRVSVHILVWHLEFPEKPTEHFR